MELILRITGQINTDIMKFADTLELMNLVGQVEGNMNAYLEVEGKQYELEYFRIGVSQSVDHKGESQSETQGGMFNVSIQQSIDDFLFAWSKKEEERKAGSIVFRNGRSKIGQTAYKIDFVDAECISLNCRVNTTSGTEVSMTISPKEITINEVLLENNWRN